MNDFDDLVTYNYASVHDGWFDFDYYENTGELSDIFDDTDIDQFINNLNCWD